MWVQNIRLNEFAHEFLTGHAFKLMKAGIARSRWVLLVLELSPIMNKDPK